jgi:hypothetical protein
MEVLDVLATRIAPLWKNQDTFPCFLMSQKSATAITALDHPSDKQGRNIV